MTPMLPIGGCKGTRCLLADFYKIKILNTAFTGREKGLEGTLISENERFVMYNM